MTNTTNIEKRDVISQILAGTTDSGEPYFKSNDNTSTANSTWSKLTHPKILTKITKDIWNNGRQIRATKKQNEVQWECINQI